MPVNYEFEWDEAKAKANVGRHGVSFEEVSTVFGGPLALLAPDPDYSRGEGRFLVLSMSFRRRVFGVGHAERPPRTRLISTRSATRHEWRQYEDKR